MTNNEIIEGLQYIKDNLFHKDKSLDEVKDWLETCIQEDKTFEDFKITLQIIIRGIDNHISNLN